jgi:hypothetical protein
MSVFVVLAGVVGLVIVVGAVIAIAGRARRGNEGDRFRHVADLTSSWSREGSRADLLSSTTAQEGSHAAVGEDRRSGS